MSREVKRVPLNFKWFEIGQKLFKKSDEWRDKIWFGYQLPSVLCKLCKGTDNDCPLCYGEGEFSPSEEPPSGEGWQMWETTSEGSPISPVFKTPEELARWLADNGASSIGHQTATYEHWFNMIKAGWAPTMMFSPQTGLVSGVEAAKKKEE